MEKIKKLRKIIQKYKIDGYLIPKNDEFFSEYIKASSDRLKYISDFSGSYGFALIFKKKSYLFVDGRYTAQANIQCGKKFIIKTLPKEMPKTLFQLIHAGSSQKPSKPNLSDNRGNFDLLF